MSETVKANKKKKSEKRQRNNVRSFRMDNDELLEFVINCDAANLTPADFIRVKCCTGKALHKRRRSQLHRLDEKMLARIIGELNKWGSNTNQIAHALNIAMKEPGYDAPYAVKTLQQHLKTIAALQTVLTNCRSMIRETLLGRDIAS